MIFDNIVILNLSLYFFANLCLGYCIFLRKNHENTIILISIILLALFYKLGLTKQNMWICFEFFYYGFLSKNIDIKRFQNVDNHFTFFILSFIMLLGTYYYTSLLNLVYFFIIVIFLIKGMYHSSLIKKDSIDLIRSLCYFLIFSMTFCFKNTSLVFFVLLIILCLVVVLRFVFCKSTNIKTYSIEYQDLFQEITPMIMLFLIIFSSSLDKSIDINEFNSQIFSLIAIIMSFSFLHAQKNVYLLNLLIYLFFIKNGDSSLVVLFFITIFDLFLRTFYKKYPIIKACFSILNLFNISIFYYAMRLGFYTQANMIYVICLIHTINLLKYAKSQDEEI